MAAAASRATFVAGARRKKPRGRSRCARTRPLFTNGRGLSSSMGVKPLIGRGRAGYVGGSRLSRKPGRPVMAGSIARIDGLPASDIHLGSLSAMTARLIKLWPLRRANREKSGRRTISSHRRRLPANLVKDALAAVASHDFSPLCAIETQRLRTGSLCTPGGSSNFISAGPWPSKAKTILPAEVERRVSATGVRQRHSSGFDHPHCFARTRLLSPLKGDLG